MCLCVCVWVGVGVGVGVGVVKMCATRNAHGSRVKLGATPKQTLWTERADSLGEKTLEKR